MTHCQLAAVIEEFDFDGELSRTQIEKAVEVADSLDRGADPDALIKEALSAGVLEVARTADSYVDTPGMVAPNRPQSFEVVEA